MNAEVGKNQINAKHAQRNHGAVGQVDDAHDAPDEGQPHCGDSIHNTNQETICERSEQAAKVHASLLI